MKENDRGREIPEERQISRKRQIIIVDLKSI